MLLAYMVFLRISCVVNWYDINSATYGGYIWWNVLVTGVLDYWYQYNFKFNSEGKSWIKIAVNNLNTRQIEGCDEYTEYEIKYNVAVYVCICMWVHVCLYASVSSVCFCICVCIWCVFLCLYVFTNMYTHTDTYATHKILLM